MIGTEEIGSPVRQANALFSRQIEISRRSCRVRIIHKRTLVHFGVHPGSIEAEIKWGTEDAPLVIDQFHPRRAGLINVLKGIYRALKPDGIYLMQDISGTSHLEEDVRHPIGTFLYTISCMHCMTVSLAQDGEGLGAMCGEEKTKEYLSKAGFRSVQTNRLSHDIQNNWYVIKK